LRNVPQTISVTEDKSEKKCYHKTHAHLMSHKQFNSMS